MVTKFMPVSYADLTSRCPLFVNFLDRIFAGNADLIGFVQRLLGYCLTADVSEHILPIWCGGGSNGKTTLQEVVRSIMGSYSMSAPASVLMAGRGDGIPNDIARLRGARFVALSETEDGKRLNETLIKTLTGGDTVVARFLYKEFFEFRMTAKFILSTNHRPEVRGQDHGIWRRLRLVPFDVTIPEAERDRHMKEKLLTEQAGILRWMVEGCLEWQRVGLGEPETVTAATAAYKRDEDTLSDFMEECCVIVPDIKTTFAAVYKRYLGWMKREGMERVSMSRKALSARLRDRSTTEGFIYGKSNRGPYFLGLALSPEGGDGDR
jgi:putative DNA primase/helicase